MQAVIKTVSEDAVPRTHFAQVTQQVLQVQHWQENPVKGFFPCGGMWPFSKGELWQTKLQHVSAAGMHIREFGCFNMGGSKNSRLKQRDLKRRNPCGLRAGTEHPGSTGLIGNRALAAPAAAGARPWAGWGEKIFSLSIILQLPQPPGKGCFLFGWKIHGLDRTFLCQQYFLSLTHENLSLHCFVNPSSLFLGTTTLLWQLPLSVPPVFSTASVQNKHMSFQLIQLPGAVDPMGPT